MCGVVRAPEVEGGELVPDLAGRGGDVRFRDAEGEQGAQLLFGDPDGGDLLAVAVAVEGLDDGAQVVRAEGLDVVPEHVVQRAGQAEFLVRVLGAVGQPPERVV